MKGSEERRHKERGGKTERGQKRRSKWRCEEQGEDRRYMDGNDTRKDDMYKTRTGKAIREEKRGQKRQNKKITEKKLKRKEEEKQGEDG